MYLPCQENLILFFMTPEVDPHKDITIPEQEADISPASPVLLYYSYKSSHNALTLAKKNLSTLDYFYHLQGQKILLKAFSGLLSN